MKYKEQPYSLVDKIAVVNERQRSLNIPHFVQHLLIDVDKNLSFWKASLCHTFFYVIALVILKDIVKDNYYSR